MPVMVVIRASKVTPQLFEATRDRVGWLETPAEGAMSHAIAFTEGGALEVTVWETRAHFETYLETRLQPAIDALGIVLDDVKVLDTHSFAVGPPALDHLVPAAAVADARRTSALAPAE